LIPGFGKECPFVSISKRTRAKSISTFRK